MREMRLRTGGTVHRLVLVAAGLIVLGGLVYVGRWLTFWYDEWSIILDRSSPGIETLLAPHVDHLSIVPIAIYQVMLRAFGMTSYWPYLALVWTFHLMTCAVLYRVVRRQAGTFVATVACISLLMLGAAFEDVLQVFQVSFLISTAFGLVAINRLSLPSVGRREVAIATFSLAIAVGSSSVGVLFMGLVLAWAILERRRDLAIGAGPVVVLYAIWYLTWGRSGQGPSGNPTANLQSIVATFGFGVGASVVALTGLPPYLYAPLGLVIGAAMLARGFLLGHRPGALGLAAMAALAAEYALQAWFRSSFGIEYAARSGYLYPAAIFLWITIADSLRGIGDPGLSRAVRVTVVLALALAIVGNATQFLGAGRAMRVLRIDEVAELRLLEELRTDTGLDRDISPDPELVPQVTAERYFQAIDQFGSPRLWIEQGQPSVVSAEANPARVNAAALRLLHRAFDLGGHTVVVRDSSTIVVDPPGSILGLPDGCLRMSGPLPFRAHWTVPPGTGIRIASDHGSGPSVGLGLRPEGLQRPGDDVMGALEGGKAVIPPTLPAGMHWQAELRLSPGTTVVCIVAPDS